MSERRLEVYLYGKKSGILSDNDGLLSYRYDKEAKDALSLRMPVRAEEYSDRECRPFFENLLPEGEVRLNVAVKERVSEGNVFSLLDSIGGDCAGAVSLYREGKKGTDNQNRRPAEIQDEELYAIIDSQKMSPLLTGKDIRLSLAGAQSKFAVYIEEGKIYYPDNAFFSSHLIKPENETFKDIAVNEYFCMKLAEKMNLPVPYVHLKKVKGKVCLLVDRFDRLIEGEKRERIHQEDFCQLLGYNPDRKYQKEGGPGFKECYRFLADYSGITSAERFVSVFVYNYLIGNCDAHAKNFSVLHGIKNIIYQDGRLRAERKAGAVTLSPFYDLVSTVVYEGLSKEMAMKAGFSWDIRKVQKSDFYRVAEEIGIKAKEFDRITEKFKAIEVKAGEMEKEIRETGFDTKICIKIKEGIKKRFAVISGKKVK